MGVFSVALFCFGNSARLLDHLRQLLVVSGLSVTLQTSLGTFYLLSTLQSIINSASLAC